LGDLVGILRHQCKTGRLLIEYPKGPATFFFQNGELVDARLNDLTGLQAICVALAQPEAAFNFNPLIKVTRRSVEPSLQRVVSELFGCWDENALQIESSAAVRTLEGSALVGDPNMPPALQARSEPLALPPAPLSLTQRRSVFFIAASVLMTVGLSTVIGVTVGFKRAQSIASEKEPAGVSSPDNQANPSAKLVQAAGVGIAVGAKPNHLSSAMERREEKRASLGKVDGRNSSTSSAISSDPDATLSKEPAGATKDTSQSLQPIRVVMQIENGRVLKASVANHKAGMDSYEALALRIARQRRYPPTVTGGETVTVSINRPE
jgi:Domain of unknown function (DUF4388)